MKHEKRSMLRSAAGFSLLVVKQAPAAIAAYGVLSLLLAAQEGLTAPVRQIFYDSLIGAALGNTGIAPAVLRGLAVIGMILLGELLGLCYSCLWQGLGDRLECGLRCEFHKKAEQISALEFEDYSFLDHIQKAQDGIYGVLGMFTVVFEVFVYFAGYFIITGLYLWHIRPVLLAALLIVFVPSAVSVFVQSRMYAADEDYLAILKRRSDSFCAAAVNPRETRLFGIFGHFYRLILETKKQIFAREYKTAKLNGAVMFGLNLFKILGWCGIAALLLRCLIRGEIGVGAFAAVYYSIGGMFDNFETLFSRLKTDIAENLGAIRNYVSFLEYPVPEGKSRPERPEDGIRAEGIRFKYPNSERWAIDGVTLSIRPGEMIALVGENGSGKTTLSKLLCGLYRPNEGRVVLNGADTAEAPQRELFARTSAVFQNYVRYSPITLGENVTISQTEKGGNAGKYLDQVKADFYRKLPDGTDTVMSREFGGTELSGGQWQRTAMARGLYRDHDFIILDEPTSAIDPLEETAVYRLFAEHSRGRTCMLITHRLGSARIADRIVVMDSGRIAEQGKHEELLARGGLYAKMWRAQAENYV